MDSYEITGGKKLGGEYTLSGAKNAVLPILAATIMTGKESRLDNCPDLSDVRNMTAILKELGCKVSEDKNCIVVDAKTLDSHKIPQNRTCEMRSSIFLMGPMLARTGKVIISTPGGCEIGSRPIDIHIEALKKLGAIFEEKDGYLECSAKKLIGSQILLSFPSVGATENAMMAAACAEGESVIKNAAREPEIVDLQNFLNSAGAKIKGAGTDEIIINGTNEFHDTQHSVISDRIEGGTFLAAAAITKGKILLKNADPFSMITTLCKLKETGCKIHLEKDLIYLEAPRRLTATSPIVTKPHPGFATDMQSQMLSILAVSKGTSFITETIFENRFKQVEELRKMGANIVVDGMNAMVTGVRELKGATVRAEDLRGGAALVIAGLGANGKTIVENICHIDRGYDKFDIALKKLGANMVRITR